MENKMNFDNDNLTDTPLQGYHETKKHTDSLFPFNIYLCTIPDDFPSVFLHWQDTMEIIYIKKGKGIAKVDLDTFQIREGDIIFAPPGHLHGLSRMPHERMEYENIIFDLSLLGSGVIDICSQKYLTPLKSGQLPFPVCITPQDALHSPISDCLNNIDRLCETCPPGYELGIKSDMFRIFSVILRHTDTRQMPDTASLSHGSPLPVRTAQKINRLKTVVDYIEKNYQRRITIDDAAALCGYSPSHFMRWFQQMTGMSFICFLNRFRLEKAYLELRNTDKSVLEVSQQCGFDNLSNFNRMFKRQFQKTPREVRF